jgi:hypothetical protein
MIKIFKSTFFKVLFLSLVSGSILQAGLVNAISIIVNDDIITLVDIDNKMTKEHISKEKATQILVDEILYKQALKKQNVSVDDMDVENYIELLAKQNKMKVYEFKNAIKQQKDYEKFKEDIKKQILHQKLLQSIAANNLKRVSEDDMKIYYKNNISLFVKTLKTDVKVYSSLSKIDLEKIKNNPMLVNNNVNIQDMTLEDSKINPQIRYILASTKEKSFSSIFKNKKIFNMFFVVKKYDEKRIPFEEAKNKIFEVMMKKRENEYLKNYFETLKMTANIKVLR